MITYEEWQTDTEGLYIIRNNVDGTKSYIKAVPENKHYAEYLRYTAWVEAGNAPEDFWTQEGDI